MFSSSFDILWIDIRRFADLVETQWLLETMAAAFDSLSTDILSLRDTDESKISV